MTSLLLRININILYLISLISDLSLCLRILNPKKPNLLLIYLIVVFFIDSDKLRSFWNVNINGFILFSNTFIEA